MGGPRFLYLDDIPTPYRLGVFRRFSQLFPGTLRIAFLAGAEPGRSWNLSFAGLDAVVLTGRQWRPPRQRTPFSYKWNPGISAFIRAFRPDVAAVSGYIHPSIQVATHVFRRCGVPYGVASESSALQGRPAGWKWSLKRSLVGPLVRGMSFGLPCGSQAEDFLRLLGARSQPMFRFPNTPDEREVARAAQAVAAPHAAAAFLGTLGIDTARRRILFVGRLIPAKRPMDLVEAYAALPAALRADTALVMAGDGELRDALVRRARDVGPGCVHFPGWIAPDAVHRLMALSDVFVLPSGHEPWGAVVNESMAAGTPVIASDRVGAAFDMIVPGETGWRFPVGDVSALTTAIEDAFADSPRLRSMRGAAVLHASKYGADRAALNLLAAVGSVSA